MKKQTEILNMRIDAHLKKTLKTEAQHQGRSMSNYILLLIQTARDARSKYLGTRK